MRMMKSLALLLFLLVPMARAADDDGTLSIDRYFDWEIVGSPQISPDGSQVVYSRRYPDRINDKFETDLWIVRSDGSRNRFLVKGSDPVWSPDGTRLAYIAPGQPSGPQIFVRWLDAPGETQVTRLERPPSNLSWSPDGTKVAFNMVVPPAEKLLTVKLPEKAAGAKWIDAPRVIGRLNYRSDGSGWNPEGFRHVFVVAADGGTARQVTSGDFQHDAPEWLDTKTIVFSGQRRPDAEYLVRESDIYAASLESREIRALTDRRGPDTAPVVSPDAKRIAYTGWDHSTNTYDVTRLYLMNADGTDRRMLTGDLDRSPAQVRWASDGSGIYFVAEDRGSNNLWFVSLAGGPARQVTTGVQQIAIESVSRGGVMAGTMTAPHRPADVIVLDPRKTQAPRFLTSVHDDVLGGLKLGAVEEIWYDSVGGLKVQGWIVKPPDFDPAKKYPLILYIHGGPHNMYGVGFNFEFQNHAANGYVVLYTNPRGSTGYGQTFGNAINNNYPGEDYDDLMRGVDAVVARGSIDEKNLFVCGGSGGGVLTAWIVGHTDRFAAAVVMKPVINWYSFVGTTDGANWYANFRKLPWEDPEEHLRRSPITYVGKVRTPTMLMTGELDLRTPMEQTEQYYRALKMQKVPTLMVRLADEYHGFNADGSVRHPSNRVQQILYLRAWFDKHKRPEKAGGVSTP